MNTSILLIEKYRTKIISFSEDKDVIVECSDKILTIETPNVKVYIEWPLLEEVYFTQINPNSLKNNVESTVERVDYSEFQVFKTAVMSELFIYISRRG